MAKQVGLSRPTKTAGKGPPTRLFEKNARVTWFNILNMEPAKTTRELKTAARRLGFELVGCCPATSPPRIDRFRRWLEAGYAGKMKYLSGRAQAYEHPRHVLENAASILMLGMNYRTDEPKTPQRGQGRVSRYAWGSADYHEVIREKLNSLADRLRELVPGVRVRGVVDTAPLLERDYASLAGLGWIGKNTLLLHKELGSWLFLAALLTNIELEYDTPFQTDHCGTCRACLDACPTQAFPQPYVLDASRCISYLTIEVRDSIPLHLRSGMGEWLFGCDICQEVCPWNQRVPLSEENRFRADSGLNPLELTHLFDLDAAAFRKAFRHLPLWRPSRRGILRNAAIVLGNQRVVESIPALKKGLHDSESVVRAACAWALAQIERSSVSGVLRERLAIEADDEVRREIMGLLTPIDDDCPAGA